MFLPEIYCGQCFFLLLFLKINCQIECDVKSPKKLILHDANKKTEIDFDVIVYSLNTINLNADHDD